MTYRTCSGYWPEPGVPCLRMLRDGVCPKQGDPHHGYRRNGPPDDPRFEWIDVSTMSQPNQWIKGACRHVSPDPVEVTDPVTGDRILVAKWCQDCDQQIWTWADDDLPEPNGFERWAYAPADSGPIPEGYRVNTLSKDPYKDLIFVGGGVINKAAPVRPPLLLRAWGAYCKITLEAWNGFKLTFRFMWPLYLVAGVYVHKLIESGVWK